MILRITQNDQGLDLPSDLVDWAPAHTSRARPNELVTLIDTDHVIEGKFNPDAGWVVARTWELHDHLIETFHNHIVTEQAIEIWR